MGSKLILSFQLSVNMQKITFNPLPLEFYTRSNVVSIARDLLGKILYTSIDNEITAGIIVETEAYAGITDKASHAYNNRRTSRTEIMYLEGGHAYVYLCYGMHSLFNVVTSARSDPQAVLIRGIEPLHGMDTMKLRSGKNILKRNDAIGPGKISKLLGINTAQSGVSLYPEFETGAVLWITDEGIKVYEDEIISGPRIGIDYAAEDALLPYRFQWAKKNKAPVGELYSF